MTAQLSGKVALITGAAGGIGCATAKLFAEHGAILSLFDRNETNLQLIAQECDKISPTKIKSFTFTGDIVDDETCAKVVEETVKLFGKIDILVNCAGIGALTHIDDFKFNVFDDIMAVNIRAIVVMSSLVIPYLKKTEGNIVSIASVAGHRTFHGGMPYGIAKAGVITHTRYAASELAKFKIRVNCISPGYVDTPLLRSPIFQESYEERKQHFISKHPIGRLGEPEEIAQSILFLASNSTASFITGTDLVIDGGMCVRD